LIKDSTFIAYLNFKAMTLEITKDNFEELVLKSKKPVLLDFYAEWCGPCKTLTPIVQELSDDYKETAVVGKLNVDLAMDIAVKYGIRGIPAVVFFKNGEEVQRNVGLSSKNVYKEILDTLI
jgi:thioredoxin 1